MGRMSVLSHIDFGSARMSLFLWLEDESRTLVLRPTWDESVGDVEYLKQVTRTRRKARGLVRRTIMEGRRVRRCQVDSLRWCGWFSSSRVIPNRMRIQVSEWSSATSGSHREGVQWASEIYEMHFGKEAHYNEDIHDIAYNGGTSATIATGSTSTTFSSGDSPARTTQWPGPELGIKGEKGKLWVRDMQLIRRRGHLRR